MAGMGVKEWEMAGRADGIGLRGVFDAVVRTVGRCVSNEVWQGKKKYCSFELTPNEHPSIHRPP
jgi:hypothetical protein